MSSTGKDITMIDMITLAGVHGYRHYRPPCGSKAAEDRFYAEFGDSSLIRFAAWLTAPKFNWGKRPTAARFRGSCDCGAQATFLRPR
jgi:hypothetical protein